VLAGKINVCVTDSDDRRSLVLVGLTGFDVVMMWDGIMMGVGVRIVDVR
jgi:hypothetical protein